MKKIVRVSLLASAVVIGGFVGNARAEGEYVDEFPQAASSYLGTNNVVGGGPVLVLNTGTSEMPTETRTLVLTPLHAQADAQPGIQTAHNPISLGSQSVGG